MGRKKGAAEPKLRAYLSKEAMLEVSPNGEFFKIFRTGEASLASNVVRERYCAVYLSRAEFEKAVSELAGQKLIALPAPFEARIDQLRTWLDQHYTGVTVEEAECESDDESETTEPASSIDICLNGIRLDIVLLNDIQQEASRLFPDMQIVFQ